MSEVNPDVLAQMKRIWSAANDGTVDKATINDALKVMHDLLTGVAYEHEEAAEAAGRAEPEGNDGPAGEDEGEDHPHKRARKKK